MRVLIKKREISSGRPQGSGAGPSRGRAGLLTSSLSDHDRVEIEQVLRLCTGKAKAIDLISKDKLVAYANQDDEYIKKY